jgi:hypothetical protein
MKMPPKMVTLTVGCVLVIVGVSLILAWWADVVALFRGGVGILLALVGLVVMALE